MTDRVILSTSELLSLVSPADPDNLVHEGNGVYAARWLVLGEKQGQSSPFADTRIIRETPGVEIVEELHESWIGEAMIHCRELRFAMASDYLQQREAAGWDMPDNGPNPLALS